MGALIGMGALINKNTFEWGRLLTKTHSKGGAFWKEGAKSNHYGIPFFFLGRRKVGVTGFCMGGALSLAATALIPEEITAAALSMASQCKAV